MQVPLAEPQVHLWADQGAAAGVPAAGAAVLRGHRGCRGPSRTGHQGRPAERLHTLLRLDASGESIRDRLAGSSNKCLAGCVAARSPVHVKPQSCKVKPGAFSGGRMNPPICHVLLTIACPGPRLWIHVAIHCMVPCCTAQGLLVVQSDCADCKQGLHRCCQG